MLIHKTCCVRVRPRQFLVTNFHHNLFKIVVVGALESRSEGPSLSLGHPRPVSLFLKFFLCLIFLTEQYGHHVESFLAVWKLQELASLEQGTCSFDRRYWIFGSILA